MLCLTQKPLAMPTVLQCAAVCCSDRESVAMRCSSFQCVAVLDDVSHEEALGHAYNVAV